MIKYIINVCYSALSRYANLYKERLRGLGTFIEIFKFPRINDKMIQLIFPSIIRCSATQITSS